MNPTRIFIAGAASAIAQDTARLFAKDGCRFFLVARDPAKLAIIAEDLRARGAAQVETAAADLDETGRHAALLDAAAGVLGGLDVVLVAYGVLPDQRACQESFACAERALRTDFLSPASLLTEAANRFEAQGSGCLAVLSSVAGERGRQSNYVYGAAKGGLTLLLQGLRNRLHKSGVRVLTIKPGFVDTPMTAGLRKNPLYASSRSVAAVIHRSILSSADVVYAPWYWREIMAAVRLVPEALFKRLSL